MIADPFEGSMELAHGIVGPELWSVTTAWYVVAVRFNKKLKQYMMIAAGTIDGEIFDAVMTFPKKCPTFDHTTKTFIDNAFIKAGKQAQVHFHALN